MFYTAPVPIICPFDLDDLADNCATLREGNSAVLSAPAKCWYSAVKDENWGGLGTDLYKDNQTGVIVRVNGIGPEIDGMIACYASNVDGKIARPPDAQTYVLVGEMAPGKLTLYKAQSETCMAEAEIPTWQGSRMSFRRAPKLGF